MVWPQLAPNHICSKHGGLVLISVALPFSSLNKHQASVTSAQVFQHHLLFFNIQPHFLLCPGWRMDSTAWSALFPLRLWWMPRVWFLTERQHGQTNRLQWNQAWHTNVYNRTGSDGFIRHRSRIHTRPGSTYHAKESKWVTQFGKSPSACE